MTIKSPFPWFGGKSRVAHIVWRAFGDVPNYVEPFAGSLAVLLSRPTAPGTETVNDLDCYVANFWRAVSVAPDDVAQWADWPVNEADLHARHKWLVGRDKFRRLMLDNPEHFDTRIAGWWLWGICQWIGSGWCAAAFGHRGHGHPSEQLPHLGAGRGIHRKLPHLGDAGRGDAVREYMLSVADRLRGVRVACGDWKRVTGDSVTFRHGLTGVLLDPPYEEESELYAAQSEGVMRDAAEWAESVGDNPLMRVAFCGYEGQPHPRGWREYDWKARGGYGSQGDGEGRANAHRERIWFSPHCLGDGKQTSLFGSAA